MVDYGVKVSKAGQDVKTATGKNLVFSSAHNTPKVKMEGRTSTTVDNEDTNTVEITHNLGYKPSFLLYWRDTGEDKTWFAMRVRSGYPKVESYVTTSKLYIKVENYSGSTKTVRLYYYIFYDEGA